MKLAIRELRALVREAVGVRYYHVSKRDLGDEVMLQPRVPKDAADMREEDFTTPRVCFTTSLRRAIDALAFDRDELGNTQASGPLHVYVTDRIPGMVRPRFGAFPPGAFDGTDDARAEALQGFVPDAGSTGEVWSLKPIRVKKLRVTNEAADCWAGSRPEEMYEQELEDDLALHKKSVLVPDDIKRSISKWSKSMGLSGRRKKR